jgi:two-component sensor histidine kinase
MADLAGPDNDPGNRRQGIALFSGLGFAASVVAALMTTWAVSMFLAVLPDAGPVAALRATGSFVLLMMLHQLPTVPLMTVLVNLAPRSGARRYLFTAASVLCVWAFCTSCFYLFGKPIWNLTYLFMVTLIVLSVTYHASARSANSELCQRENAALALDAEVKRARLQLLRAQIEPHFLFNTLATVRTLARTDHAAAAAMIEDLEQYLAEAMPRLKQDESSLADELRLINAYLRIHQVRMGARLSFELTVPDSLGAHHIPSMMLLTLVENALKHGIGPTVEGGSIQVSARREPTALVMKVADSGSGLAATQGYGIGLANIRRRLTMLYGDDAELTLGAAAARGTIATVSIPLALPS